MRKAIHFSMGFFALLLKFLTPIESLLCAAVAFLHNLYIFPLYGRKKIETEFEKERKYSGIVSYPAVVFFIILFSYITNYKDAKTAMSIAASSWAVLAFGDSTAGFFGKLLNSPKLLWNKEKSWSGFFAFIIFTLIFSYSFFNFSLGRNIFEYDINLFALVFLAAISCAVIESLSGQFDDNISFPFVAFSIFSFYSVFDLTKAVKSFAVFNYQNSHNAVLLLILFLINFGFGFAALFKKWVDTKGFIFGVILGCAVIISLGIKGYFILVLFFLFANFSTFYKSNVKEKRGIAEKNSGRRGIESVFSKGFAPLLFSFLSFESFALCLSFYASDTVATEFGKTSKGKTFSLINIKEVKAGKSGGVTFKGSLFGIISIFLFNLVALFDVGLKSLDLKFYLLASALVTLFFFVESIINDVNEKMEVTSKVVIHIVLGFLLGSFANALAVYMK